MRPLRRNWVPLLAVLFAVAVIGVGTINAGTYLDSPHGDATDGVNRVSGEYAIGHCANCHDPHSGTTGGYNLIYEGNAMCYNNGGANCHNAQPTSYPCGESDRLPGTDTANGWYFENNTGGTKDVGLEYRCRWPGSTEYNDTTYSPHYFDTDMPKRDSSNRGLCTNCHNPHGVSGSQLDMLMGVYNTPGGTSNYTLCFQIGTTTCHDTGGVPSETANKLIKGFYDNADNQAGHKINCSSKSVQTSSCPPTGITVGDKMPCYNCHNPHGSENNNAYLLSDQSERGWSNIDMSTASEVRTFCFGCHVANDGTAGSKTVMNISMNTIPNVSGAHETSATASCYDCHDNDYTAASDKNVHHPGSGGECATCHASSISGTACSCTRRAITGEFGSTTGHLKSGRDTVDSDDCVVCHMEGTSTASPTPSAKHADGVVDLRDPDTGNQIQYSGSDYSFTQFARNVSSSTLETMVTVVQNQHCLKCHDSSTSNPGYAGAASTSAQVTDATNDLNPWNQSGVAVLDIYGQFSTTNATFHPVRGAQNNDYCDIDTMVTPWNQYTKTSDGGLTDGDLISCFDCHNAVSELSTGTIPAHGGTVMLRAAYDATAGEATKICTECHTAATYWPPNVGGTGTGSTHLLGSKSAFNATSADSDFFDPTAKKAPYGWHDYARTDWYGGCTICHGMTAYPTTLPSVGSRGPNVHGTNTIGTGGSAWSSGASPWSFMRNTNNYGDWDNSPATCTDMCGTSRDYTYSPGGTY